MRPLFVSVFLASLGTLCVPSVAMACGGMFCSVATAQNPAPAPVDQTAERIVFEVDPGTITAHVQIQYTGEADQFAWVVPVPNAPTVEESSLSFIQSLDQRTAMNVVLPTVPTCEGVSAPTFDDNDGGGCVCGMASDDGNYNEPPPSAPDPEADDPVTVYNEGFTNNYEFAIIGAEQASDLTEWLQMNGYNVSDNMIPVMQPYVDQEMVFLGLKLQDGKSASDIVPIAITYEDTQPMIPIQLTAVAAQPMMGILVFILADEFYSPANFDSIAPAADEILHDQNGNTNYFDWMARRAGQAEGKMWVQEFVGDAPQVIARIRHSRVSRYYARMSPEHMTVDPVFIEAPAQGEMAATLDLTGRPSMVCTDFSGTLPTVDDRLPAQCAWQFCGMSGECVVDDSNPGCICNNNTVAQTFQGPNGQPRITCVPAENPYGITAQAGGEGTEFDPCTNFECGAGTCQLKSGFPTCACDDGAAAFISSGLPRCREVAADAPTYGPGAGLESEGSTEPLDNGSGGGNSEDNGEEDGEGSTGMGALIPLGLGLGLLMALRRRREQ